MARCNKCGNTFGCACSMVTIDGLTYCKSCAVQIYKTKNAIMPNQNNIPPQNTTLYTLKNLNNKKP